MIGLTAEDYRNLYCQAMVLFTDQEKFLIMRGSGFVEKNDTTTAKEFLHRADELSDCIKSMIAMLDKLEGRPSDRPSERVEPKD